MVYPWKLKKGYVRWVTLAKKRIISTWLHFEFPDTERLFFLLLYIWLNRRRIHKHQSKIFFFHTIQFFSHCSLELRISLI